MSYTKFNTEVSIPAGADLRTAQYTFVKLSAGKVVQCDGYDDEVVGVLGNTPEADDHALVCIKGVTPIRLSGTLASGVKIGTDDDGLAQAIAVNSQVVGQLLIGGDEGALGTLALNTSASKLRVS